jgi:hypothetical protein
MVVIAVIVNNKPAQWKVHQGKSIAEAVYENVQNVEKIVRIRKVSPMLHMVECAQTNIINEDGGRYSIDVVVNE